MKVWMNVYDRPPKALSKNVINADMIVGGVFPGTAFFPSKEAAMAARQVAMTVESKWDQQAVVLHCIEIELPDAKEPGDG